MSNAVFGRLSSLLYRASEYIKRKLGKRSTFRPYQLRYNPSTSNTRIVHINGNFVIGGSTQLIIDLIERSSDQFNHEVIVPHHPQPLPYQPVSIRTFPNGRLDELDEYLRNQPPALVHIHYWVRERDKDKDFANWYNAVFAICEKLKLPVVQNINVPTAPHHSTSIVHNVFVSEYVRSQFNDSDTPSSVIYPGSNTSFFEANTKHPLNTVGMVYRLDQDKLDEKAIEVFIEAVRKNHSLHCYIIGGGHYFRYYQERVRAERQSSNFTFTGYVSYEDLPSWYEKFSICVAPVYDESFGQVTPFAMSSGLAIAGYDTGALSEILGGKGTLVPFGDVNALADLIITLNDNPGKIKLQGEQNRERARKLFDVSAMIHEYSSLYSQLITGHDSDLHT